MYARYRLTWFCMQHEVYMCHVLLLAAGWAQIEGHQCIKCTGSTDSYRVIAAILLVLAACVLYYWFLVRSMVAPKARSMAIAGTIAACLSWCHINKCSESWRNSRLKEIYDRGEKTWGQFREQLDLIRNDAAAPDMK